MLQCLLVHGILFILQVCDKRLIGSQYPYIWTALVFNEAATYANCRQTLQNTGTGLLVSFACWHFITVLRIPPQIVLKEAKALGCGPSGTFNWYFCKFWEALKPAILGPNKKWTAKMESFRMIFVQV